MRRCIMGFRFHRSVKILPGVKININKKSSSITFGPKGAHYTINSKGKLTTTVGLPGTGLSYTTSTQKKHSRTATPTNATAGNKPAPPSPTPKEKWYKRTIGIILMLFIFFPIGLFLMWKYSRWPKSIKWTITGFLVLCMIFVPKNDITAPLETTKTTAAVSTPKETIPPKTDKISITDESNNATNYHRDKNINELITQFNAISSKPILLDEVGQDFSYQTFINSNDVNIRISHSSSGIFVDLTQESTNDTDIWEYFCDFVKCLETNITDDELSTVIQSLQTGNYKNYNKLNFNGLSSTYSTQKLNNGKTRYTLKTEKLY